MTSRSFEFNSEMPEQLNLQVKNAFAEIPVANEAASHWLADRHAPPAADYLANLAIEELVTNCIKYGYDDTNEHVIEIELSLSSAELVLTVTDDGHPFNPLELAEPDTTVPVEDRAVGGLGLHLLRKMSDRMEYARADGKNRLTIRKSLSG
jgi:anti-sigma regulatory factor (Ser/Thr protein kinase)